MEMYKVKIIKIKEEAPGTKTFFLEKPKEASWSAGSHMHVGLPGFDKGETLNKELVRHMSINTLLEEEMIGFTTRVPGSGSPYKVLLDQMQVGEELTVFKIGNRIPLKREERPVVVASMGVGISTMRPLILSYLRNQERISSFWNLNIDASSNFLFQTELDTDKVPGYQTIRLSDRDAYYNELEQLAEIQGAIYYMVGSDAFLEESIACLVRSGVKKESILLDKKPERIAVFLR